VVAIVSRSLQQVANRPDAVGDANGHRRVHAEGLVNATEVVPANQRIVAAHQLSNSLFENALVSGAN